MVYIPLHVHTATGSVGDSILKIKDYVNTAKGRGLISLAITDHGSLSSMYEFISACTEAGVKPVVGMEAYVVEDADIQDKGEQKYHLVLLAKDDEGLENLLQIHNDAQLRGFYGKPRTDYKALQQWNKGIIALSACIMGEIPQAIIDHDIEKIERKISLYKKIFGDNFFFEIQPGRFKKQLVVNDILVYLSRELDIPLVVTNDIHYLRQEDYLAHDYHIKLGFMKDKEDFDSSLRYPDTCYWFMEEKDILSAFEKTDLVTEEVIRRGILQAQKIAASCNITTDISVSFPETGYEDEPSALRKIIDEALIPYEDKQEYIDRVEREMSVIEKKNFCGYFLVLYDLVKWCQEQGILLGPGRGSAAGCLISFLLGITKVDPLKYGLLFERFLDENRTAIPD